MKWQNERQGREFRSLEDSGLSERVEEPGLPGRIGLLGGHGPTRGQPAGLSGWLLGWAILLLTTLAATGCSVGNAEGQSLAGPGADVSQEFRLRTAMVDGRMAFVGVGGEIDGAVNPELVVAAGEPVRLILENGDGMMHDLAIPGLGVQTATTMRRNSEVEVTFTVERAGTYLYYCTVSGHRQAGMEGVFTIQ